MITTSAVSHPDSPRRVLSKSTPISFATLAMRSMSVELRATQITLVAPSLCSATSADLAVAPEPKITPDVICETAASVTASTIPWTSVLNAWIPC